MKKLFLAVLFFALAVFAQADIVWVADDTAPGAYFTYKGVDYVTVKITATCTACGRNGRPLVMVKYFTFKESDVCDKDENLIKDKLIALVQGDPQFVPLKVANEAASKPVSIVPNASPTPFSITK